MKQPTKRDIIEALVGIVTLLCTDMAGEVDSWAESENAFAIRTLADLGIIEIENEHGHRVIGKFTEKAKEYFS